MELMKNVNGELVPLTAEDIAQMELDRQEYEAEQEARAAQDLAEYMQEFRDMRRELLNVLAGIAIAEDLQAEFKVLRQVLLDIPQAEEVAKATTAAEAKQAIKIEYAKSVAQAPAAFVIAFKELSD